MKLPLVDGYEDTSAHEKEVDNLFRDILLDFNGNVLTPSPIVIIGCGGMGKLVVNMLKRKLFLAFGLDPENPGHSLPFIVFIAIDTAEVDIAASGWYLNNNEYLRVSWHTKSKIEELLKDRDLMDRLAMPENINADERVERVLDELMDSLDGCSQVRLVGRLCLFMENSLQKVTGAIQSGLETLHNQFNSEDHADIKFVWDNHKSSFLWRRRDRNKLKFLVVSSLGGGTGTGIFMDIAAIIRGILDEPYTKDQLKYGRNAKTFGVLILPHCMETHSNREKLRANSYPALKDLDYFMSGNTFDVDYSMFDSQLGRVILDHKAAENRLFQGVYLFEGESSNNTYIRHDTRLNSLVDKRFRVGDELSEFLSHCFIFDSCNGYWTLFPNKTGGDSTFRDIDASGYPAEFMTHYSSFGISSLIYPYNTLIKQLENRWMRKVTDHLITDIDIKDDALTTVLSVIRDQNAVVNMPPESLRNTIAGYRFQRIVPNNLNRLDNDIVNRAGAIREESRKVSQSLSETIALAYGLTFYQETGFSVPPNRKIEKDQETMLNTLIDELRNIKEDYEKAILDAESATDPEIWAGFLTECRSRYNRENQGLKKRKKSWYSMTQPSVNNERRENEISPEDLSRVNDYLENVLIAETHRQIVSTIDRLISSLDQILARTSDLQTKQLLVLDRLRQKITMDKSNIIAEYDNYEGIFIKDLISRRKYNLMASSQELEKVSKELKKAVKEEQDTEIDLRRCVTPHIRAYIERKKGIENCDEAELFRELKSRMNNYLHDFKFRKFFFSQSLGDGTCFLKKVSHNFTQFETDMTRFSEPYIKISQKPRWAPEPYIVEPSTESIAGGHRNKITRINIIGGFSAHQIESLPDWRKDYEKMRRQHILQIFAGSETRFPELAYLDRNIKNMDPEKLINIMVTAEYLCESDNNITIRSLPRKTGKFKEKIIRVKTSLEDVCHLLIHESKNRLILLDLYLNFMWQDRKTDFSWLKEVPWIPVFYGKEKFDRKYNHILDKMNELEIEIEDAPPSLHDIVRIFMEHHFFSQTNGDLNFFSNTRIESDHVACEVSISKDELVREVLINKWFLEELMLGFCDYLNPDSTNVVNYQNDLKGYLDSERNVLPEILRLTLEKKLWQ